MSNMLEDGKKAAELGRFMDIKCDDLLVDNGIWFLRYVRFLALNGVLRRSGEKSTKHPGDPQNQRLNRVYEQSEGRPEPSFAVPLWRSLTVTRSRGYSSIRTLRTDLLVIYLQLNRRFRACSKFRITVHNLRN